MQASSSVKRPPATGAISSDPRAVAEQLDGLWRQLFLDSRADHLGAIEEHNLSLTQVRVLALLSAAEQPLPAGELAERLGLSPAAITRALDSLVRRGLTSRRECSDDRRVRLIGISNAGAAIIEELLAMRTAGLERFIADLTVEQREQLSAALVAIDPGAGGQQ